MAIRDEELAQGFPPTTTRDDVRAGLQPLVQPIQVVMAALPLGALTLLAAVAGIYATHTQVAPAGALGTSHLMSINTAIVTVGSWIARGVVGQQVLSGKTLRQSGPPVVRAWCILRAALAEGPALVGLVICLISATNGALRADPLLWLNLLPLALMLAVTAATFPTLEGLTDKVWARLQDGS